MITVFIILATTSAYLLGSIPTAVWVSRLFHGIDIREHGSGNAGATNVIRVLGWKTGIPVLLVDVAKGWLAASLPVVFNLDAGGSSDMINLQILCGIAAITGHVYPVFAGFMGGKGVGTTVGVLLALNPLLTLLCLGLFIAVLLVTGYVSVASMSFGIAFPLFLFTLFGTPSVIFKIFSVIMAVLLIFTHRSNIRRLMKREESKFIRRKNKSQQ